MTNHFQYLLKSTVLILPLLVGNLNAQDIYYFRNLTGIISPSFEYRGRFPLSNDELDEKPYYQFTSDSLGRITSIEYYRRGHLNNDSYFQTAVVQYVYGEHTLTRTYYDHNMQPKAMWRHYYGDAPIYKEVFTLDEYGRKIELQLLNESNDRISDQQDHYTFQWTYPDSYIIEQRQFDKDGKLILLTNFFDYHVTQFHVDFRGYLRRIANMGIDNKQLTNGNQTGTAYVDFYFDEYGYEHRYPHFDASGKKVDRKPYGGLYHINSIVGIATGNVKMGQQEKVIQRYRNANGDFTSDQNGIARIDYIDNEFLELQQVKYFDINDAPTTSGGYHSISIEYNKFGDRSKLQFRGIDGKLVNSTGGHAVIEIEYDDNRNIKEQKRYDKKNQLINE